MARTLPRLRIVDRPANQSNAHVATHFLMKRPPKVTTEIALHVLAHNLTRIMNIVGVKPLLAAIRA
jgi:hypothetical protein